MRVLLDECLPRGLRKHLSPHEVTTVQEAGWSGEKNGVLLRLAVSKFDAFVTVDKNLVHQQHVASLPYGVVVVAARSNRLSDLLPLVPGILKALASVQPGEVTTVGG